ncbi:MAG: hypothetical protein HW386_1652 [Gammaproteobacteria bacterium]|nr:hypothetical protein [Gammaproteobacteria bacterium]
MQMGGGDPAGLANVTNDLACRDDLPRMHRYLLQMAVHGEQSLAMVDKDGIAVKEILPGLLIEKAAQAKRTAVDTGDRLGQQQ